LTPPSPLSFFFFYAPATTAIYTLSLHDALPILGPALKLSILKHLLGSDPVRRAELCEACRADLLAGRQTAPDSNTRFVGAAFLRDRKSTRLNSSHRTISYAVFCLKKKKKRDYNN